VAWTKNWIKSWIKSWSIPNAVVEDRPLNVAITTLIVLWLCHGVPIAPETVGAERSSRAMIRPPAMSTRVQTARAYMISSGDCCVTLERFARHAYFERLSELIALSQGE
jgi:hypothetical protein